MGTVAYLPERDSDGDLWFPWQSANTDPVEAAYQPVTQSWGDPAWVVAEEVRRGAWALTAGDPLGAGVAYHQLQLHTDQHGDPPAPLAELLDELRDLGSKPLREPRRWLARVVAVLGEQGTGGPEDDMWSDVLDIVTTMSDPESIDAAITVELSAGGPATLEQFRRNVATVEADQGDGVPCILATAFHWESGCVPLVAERALDALGATRLCGRDDLRQALWTVNGDAAQLQSTFCDRAAMLAAEGARPLQINAFSSAPAAHLDVVAAVWAAAPIGSCLNAIDDAIAAGLGGDGELAARLAPRWFLPGIQLAAACDELAGVDETVICAVEALLAGLGEDAYHLVRTDGACDGRRLTADACRLLDAPGALEVAAGLAGGWDPDSSLDDLIDAAVTVAHQPDGTGIER